MGLEWWQIVIGVIVGLLILTILVIIHELGHAWLARRHGVDVEEFGIGFPPRAKLLGKYKGTEVTLNWLPLGGFCKMKGESDDAKGRGAYGAASLSGKAQILLAGVVANFLTACLLFTVLAFFGIPKLINNQFSIAADDSGQAGIVAVYSVVKNSPAEKANLTKGDQIIAIDGQKIELSSDLPAVTRKLAGQKVKVDIVRKGVPQSMTIQLGDPDKEKTGILGVQTGQVQTGTVKATWSAPLVGIGTTVQFFWVTIVGLIGMIGNLFAGVFGLFVGAPSAGSELATVRDSVSGPVGILGQIFPTAVAGGATMIVFVSAIISVSLAVMNLLPIPGLDGGRLYLTLWYRLRKKTLTKEREQLIVGRGMMFLFALIALITIVDILRYL